MQWTIWDRYVLVHIKRLITVLVEARQWLSYGLKIETLGNKANWESNGATRRHTIPATDDVSDNCQSANLDQIQGIRGYLKVIQIITN